ncbi:hypothetical protein HDU93_005190 [Gonapodya sp. JEL0774]|nr:hypothetical protein HDU93_005190 [Gonapodya sp. JEL0774]
MDKGFGSTLGVHLVRAGPGWLELGFLAKNATSQPSGYVHGGAISALHDIANGKAAYTLAPSTHVVLTVELKTNILRPTPGSHTLTLCRAHVVKGGRNIVVGRADCIYWTLQGRDGAGEGEEWIQNWDWQGFSELIERADTYITPTPATSIPASCPSLSTSASDDLLRLFGVRLDKGKLASTSLQTCMLVEGRETWANE